MFLLKKFIKLTACQFPRNIYSKFGHVIGNIKNILGNRAVKSRVKSTSNKKTRTGLFYRGESTGRKARMLKTEQNGTETKRLVRLY